MVLVTKLARSPALSGSLRRYPSLTYRPVTHNPVLLVASRSSSSPLSSITLKYSQTLPSSQSKQLIRFYSTPTPTSTTAQPVYAQTENGLPIAHDAGANAGVNASAGAGDATAHVVDGSAGIADAVVPVTIENFSTFPPVVWCGELMSWVHHAGLPWWATIMVATLGVRIILFPIMGKVMKNNLKLAAVKPVLDSYNAKIRMAVNPQQREQATRDLYSYMATEGVQPWKSMLGVLAQAPVFMLFYFTLKGLTENNIDGMDHGGALWFTNLTIPDPYYILSAMTACTFIAAIELGADSGQSMAKTASFIKNIFRFMGVAFIPITATFQSGMLIYWCFNSLLSLVQMMIFKLPAVRAFFKLPKPATATPKVLIPDVVYTSANAKTRKAVQSNKK